MGSAPIARVATDCVYGWHARTRWNARRYVLEDGPPDSLVSKLLRTQGADCRLPMLAHARLSHQVIGPALCGVSYHTTICTATCSGRVISVVDGDGVVQAEVHEHRMHMSHTVLGETWTMSIPFPEHVELAIHTMTSRRNDDVTLDVNVDLCTIEFRIDVYALRMMKHFNAVLSHLLNLRPLAELVRTYLTAF